MSTTTVVPSISPAAARMREFRRRRRRGLRNLNILMAGTEIDELVRRGFLDQEKRNDPHALRCGIYEALYEVLSGPMLHVTADPNERAKTTPNSVDDANA